jgi:hypothetical protein
MREPGAREYIAQVRVRVHPQHTEALILIPLALRLEDRYADRMIPTKDDRDIG